MKKKTYKGRRKGKERHMYNKYPFLDMSWLDDKRKRGEEICKEMECREMESK